MTTYTVLLSKTMFLAAKVLVEAETEEDAVEQIRSGLADWTEDPEGELAVGNPWSMFGDTDPGADSDHRILALGLASDGDDGPAVLEDIAISDTDGLVNSEFDVRFAVRHALRGKGTPPGRKVFALAKIYTGKAERVAYVEAESYGEAMQIARGEIEEGEHEWTYLPQGFVPLPDHPVEHEVIGAEPAPEPA